MYRRRAHGIELLLIHPGGPFWSAKDLGAWSIPKGEYDESEAPLVAAQREFGEETGWTPTGPYLPLGSIKQRSGKIVTAWAFEGDFDPATLVSNTFEMQWPPRSGRMQVFPEVDRGEWFDVAAARRRIIDSQAVFIDELEKRLRETPAAS